MARNTGIESAVGEYICFFDSDDFVECNTIETAYTAAVTHNADLVCFGMYNVDAKGRVKNSKVPKAYKEVYRNQEVCTEFLKNLIGPDPETGIDFGISMSACCKLFSMKCIQKNNWSFVSEKNIISEDFYSLLQLYPDIDSVCIVPRALYYYCENAESVTHTYRPDRYMKIKHFYVQTKELCRSLNYSTEIIDRFRKPYLSFTITALKQEMSSPKNIIERIQAVREIVDDTLLQHTLAEGRMDRTGVKQKILFWSIREKHYFICCILLTAQNFMNN